MIARADRRDVCDASCARARARVCVCVKTKGKREGWATQVAEMYVVKKKAMVVLSIE